MSRDHDITFTNNRTGESWVGRIIGSGDWGIRGSRPGHTWGFQMDDWELADDTWTFEEV